MAGWTDRFRFSGRPTRAKLWWLAAIVAVVAVVSAVSAVLAVVWRDEQPPPDYKVRQIEGFPEYDKGTRTEGVTFYPRINTPGKLRILLNGKPADECESWDYQVRICPTAKIDGSPMWRQYHFATGQQVTVTVVAERTTGDWEVGVKMY